MTISVSVTVLKTRGRRFLWGRLVDDDESGYGLEGVLNLIPRVFGVYVWIKGENGMKFSAGQFVPTKWDSAEDKAKFANHFVRFVETDFSANLFYDWFYRRLSNTFGHIAHCDRSGFYAEFFATIEGRLRFLEITAGVTTSMGGIGDPAWTYSDVERELRSWVFVNGFVEKYREIQSRVIATGERAELARLKAKYERGGI